MRGIERLTELFTDEYGHKCCAIVGCKEVCEHGWTEDESGCRCDKVGEMQIRLAIYEDIDTPEQCAARVEVVRCGSCIHKGRPMPHSAMKKWFCTTHGTFMDVDGFCSYGERRE